MGTMGDWTLGRVSFFEDRQVRYSDAEGPLGINEVTILGYFDEAVRKALQCESSGADQSHAHLMLRHLELDFETNLVIGDQFRVTIEGEKAEFTGKICHLPSNKIVARATFLGEIVADKPSTAV